MTGKTCIIHLTAQHGFSEFSPLINYLGVPAGTWPESQQAFWIHWDGRSDCQVDYVA